MIQRNVVIVPEGFAADESYGQNKVLVDQFGSLLDLDPTFSKAHLSFYQAAYPDGSHQAIAEAVEEVATFTPTLLIQMSGYRVHRQSFIFWMAERTPELYGLHQQLVRSLNPLRDGLLLLEHETLLASEATPEEVKDNVRQYGYPSAMERYAPHITEGYCSDSSQAQAAEQYLLEQGHEGSWTAHEICIGTVGEYGSCPTILQRFPLTGTSR